MKIKLKADHKSIKERIEFELPEFCVLTGKNGSGKTHLLEVLANKDLTNVIIDGKKVLKVRYIEFNALNPNITENCDPDSINQHIKSSWSNLHNAIKNLQRNYPGGFDNSILLQNIARNEPLKRHIEKIIEEKGKEYDKITEDDLYDTFEVSFMGQNDFFTAQFALIFKHYHKLLLENQENQFYEANGLATTNTVLTQEQFVEKHGEPPWEFVNKILLEMGIPYEVNSPLGGRKETSFILKLKDREGSFEISSSGLSTGEKVLMSLALAIYNTGGYDGKPELLLIDEPDAALHPSMTMKMVEILKKNIVLENNIPTIITTHSPTTVVAAEGISIYQLERGNNKPDKISIQKAVELLSGDIPFLKISTERRRQVFVESKYDVLYYELLTNIYGRITKFCSEPIYIPARTSNGSNCSDVIGVVNNLYSNGNDQIYGIIDWDLKNISSDRILVLGEGDRYAIDNYLLDPLLMGLLMIRESKVPIDEFGELGVQTYSQMGNLKKEEAQSIINKILEDLGLDSENKSDYETFNGWKLQISEDFNKHNGHDLEEHFKKTFHFLNVYQKEYELKKAVIEKVINDFPYFAPVILSETIAKIN